MKKQLISLVIGLAVSGSAMADDLMQVYQAAVQNDTQLLSAKASRDLAHSRIKTSFANLLPSVDLTVTAGKGFGDAGTSESSGATLSLNQAVYNPALWNGFSRAEKSASQADANLGAATQGLIVRTVKAYFDVLAAQDDLEFAIAEKRAIERQLEQTRQRFAVGLTAITDVHEAQAQFDTAVASEISAQNNVEISREALREITGQYHQEINVLNTDRFSTEKPMPTEIVDWVALGEANNLGLLAAKIGVDIAKEDIDTASAGHMPTVSLSASAGTNSDELFLGTPRADSQSIGLTVRVPIYSGGSTTAGVEQAQHSFIIASEDREAQHRSMVRSVRSAYYDVIASISRTKALEQAVVSAESALGATQAGFEVGTRTIVDVLNSTRNVFDAKRRLSSTRYGYILSILSLKQAAGNLSEQDVASINQGLQK